jgi:hypothetical protein
MFKFILAILIIGSASHNANACVGPEMSGQTSTIEDAAKTDINFYVLFRSLDGYNGSKPQNKSQICYLAGRGVSGFLLADRVLGFNNDQVAALIGSVKGSDIPALRAQLKADESGCY